MTESKKLKWNKALTRLMVILGLGGGLMLLYSNPDADPEKYRPNKKLENIGLITMGTGMLCALGAAATEKKDQSR